MCRRFALLMAVVPAVWAGGSGTPAAAQTISPHVANVARLRQTPPAVYRLAAGDVLGVFIDGVLGSRDQPIPVHFPNNGGEPSTGYPTPVRDDGTISLPFVAPISVAGLSVAEAEEAIRRAYTVEQKILQPERDRILVSLMHKRTVEVLVVRQDVGSGVPQPPSPYGLSRRGSVSSVRLKAGENDILHALVATGGLPGLDAKNEVVVYRGRQAAPQAGQRFPLFAASARAAPRNVGLAGGDVVYIAQRDRAVYYTGGLLAGGAHVLPRDRDLTLAQAILGAGGPPGAGPLRPTDVLLVRPLAGGGLQPLRLDYNAAILSPAEGGIVQPGDVIWLRQQPHEWLGNLLLSRLSLNAVLGALGR